MHDRSKSRVFTHLGSITSALAVAVFGGVVAAYGQSPQSAEVPEISAGAEAAQQTSGAPVNIGGPFDTGSPSNFMTTTLGVGWDAINFNGNTMNTYYYQIPPDPNGAASSNHVVDVVNSSIEVFAKDGTLLNTQRLGRNGAGSITGAFFQSLNPANTLYDPRIIFDRGSRRYVVLALEQVSTAPTASRILVAVSAGEDPTGGWYFTAINSQLNINAVDTWADYPGLAFDKDVLYITTNQYSYSSAFQGQRLWIVDKTSFYAGGPAVVTVWDPSAATGQSEVSATPTSIYGTGPAVPTGTWLVRYSAYTDGINEYLSIIRVENPLNPAGPSFNHQFLYCGNIDSTTAGLRRAAQPGTTIRIDVGDRRALGAVWRDNLLWVVADIFPVRPDPSVGQTTAHWWAVDTSNPAALALADQGNIGGEELSPSTTTFFPSIAVNHYDDVAIGFSASSPTMYAGAFATGRRATDPAGTMMPPITLAPGLDSYVRTFTSGSTGRNRWGDYSGTCLDIDGCTFWHFNEFAWTHGDTTNVGGATPEFGRWGTHWASWTFCSPVPVELAYFTAERNGEAAVLRWSVASSSDHAGFNVYRSTDGGERALISSALLSGKTDYAFTDAAAPATGGEYWLQEISRSGRATWYGPATLAPASFRAPVLNLAPSRPNPFRTATTIAYSLPSTGPVRLAVCDVAGRKLATLVSGVQPAGDHVVSWNGRLDGGRPASAGFYVIRLEAAGAVRTQKIVMTK